MATSSSSINLGSIVTAGGAPRLSGTSSSLDIEGLVTSLVEARKLPAVRLETRIAANGAKVAAPGAAALRQLCQLCQLRRSIASLTAIRQCSLSMSAGTLGST